MTLLNEVSQTAIITLKARSIESKKNRPIIQGSVDDVILTALNVPFPDVTSKNIFHRNLPASLTRYIALRARKYDNYAKEFLDKYPNGLVVSLGCGFDTRYWRVSDNPWQYIEIDLPEVIKVKKRILKSKIDYVTIDCSVSDKKWMKQIAEIQNENILFLAEGLFMYLSEDVVKKIFERISQTFSKSSIVFEAVNRKYTKGIWKKIVESKMKRVLGSDAGISYDFGLYSAKEIESFGNNIEIVEEWSYFEDKDVKPKFLYLLKNIKFFSKTQWTIKAQID